MPQDPPGSNDPFRPPDIPIEVHCIHCGEEYDSYLIKWVPDEKNPNQGFWSCPTPGCDGIGFCFDIWPTDPDWRDENGEKVSCFDEDEDDDEEYSDELDAADELPDPDNHNGKPHSSDTPPDSTLDEDDIPF